MKRERTIRALIVLAVLCIAYFVWPTPWRYSQLRWENREMPTRMNRLTGKVQCWLEERWDTCP
jgi:hypothetical protein